MTTTWPAPASMISFASYSQSSYGSIQVARNSRNSKPRNVSSSMKPKPEKVASASGVKNFSQPSGPTRPSSSSANQLSAARVNSTFSCDIAYSESPAASRASASSWGRKSLSLLHKAVIVQRPNDVADEIQLDPATGASARQVCAFEDFVAVDPEIEPSTRERAR